MTKKFLSLGSLLFLLLSYLQPFTVLFTDSFFVFGITPSVIPRFFPLIFALIALGLGIWGLEGGIWKTLVNLLVRQAFF